MSSTAKKRKSSRIKSNVCVEEDENSRIIILPSADYSGESDSDVESEEVGVADHAAITDFQDENVLHEYSELSGDVPGISYRKVLDTYGENQEKLEPDHEYEWVDGECVINDTPDNALLLPTNVQNKIRDSSLVDLFQLFFSLELKEVIVDATRENGYDLTIEELDVFVGILITSMFNGRKSQKDYWSRLPLLRCEPIAAAMSRNKYSTIKEKIKMSKDSDGNSNDRAWRVRKPLEIFRKNIKCFGYFSTALSVDEMMIKFYGRTVLKQYIQNKLDRFGIKMWALCMVNGFLLDCDIYCGKGTNIYASETNPKLSKCALGSRVVLQMVQNLLLIVTPRKLYQYHLTFDNFFTGPDLLVHLKNIGLRATGTVRSNRIKTTNEIDKKSKRGTFVSKYDKNSGLNYITVMYSKPLSVLSTCASVRPFGTVRRYSKEQKKKETLEFPRAFTFYNQYMGGVDLHDSHCSNLRSPIRSKKWTWVIFMRLIQSSITNATVLENLVTHDKKIGTKDTAQAVAESYLAKSSYNLERHRYETAPGKKYCTNSKSCGKRTTKKCTECNTYQCLSCFTAKHKK
ncbi:piggyBac transposable element-derived protein 3-like [Phymastichus coffea]|uniref:piggyBac transposable element-derived protein 3-like n=1 Tax=Phymastichus coffea TaxID=108790 RepID=UPI00273AE445|nr:piggyBac transposable element-derived protein 3-like [Phymastichus coffea]